ncbi:MAG: M20/M25/M40 family metallo-hydrolase [Deltaproteobacteria bacterium]|nr:M20/M25/M40 family metallo-hydrolase [Deltaproteobacteria bacterium]
MLLVAILSCAHSTIGVPAPVAEAAPPDPPSPLDAPAAPPRDISPPSPDPADAARQWQRLAELCDGAGHRLAGSPGQRRAEQITAGWFDADGVSVRLEPVKVPTWIRGDASLQLSAPYAQSLPVLALGGSVATPATGLEAPLVVVHDFAELDGAVKGKIVLYDVPMKPGVPAIDYYGDAVAYRGQGPSRAAEHGAVAVLVRSVTTRSLGTIHTGGTWYAPEFPKIPAAAVSTETAAMLSRLVERGEVKLKLSMSPRYAPDSDAFNVVGEIRGRDLPGEIVVVGAHLDSWDVGQGAHDDGAGVVHVVEAMRAIAARGQPRRTIRGVLFANEENGLRGGRAYFAAHGHERHVAALETDLGGGSPRGWGVTATPEQRAWIEPMLSASRLWVREGGGGADISPLTGDGVLSVGLIPDDEHYFDYHHTWADTVDKVDPIALAEGTIAITELTWVLANADGAPPKGTPPSSP